MGSPSSEPFQRLERHRRVDTHPEPREPGRGPAQQPPGSAVVLAAILALAIAVAAAAHVHVAENTPQQQALANGQNHPGFQPVGEDGLRLSCEGVLGYGLETAHHVPTRATRARTTAATPWSATRSTAMKGARLTPFPARGR